MINSRKHAFKKNRVSGSLVSDHYEGITKTEFEERLNLEKKIAKTLKRRMSTKNLELDLAARIDKF